ncbi:MAG: hypothetical protein PHE36_00350 [Novosphingobium sp.]|nr:hypothetical protein [Novosphingobium sp.]
MTTTDVTLSEPASHAALANTKAGIAEMGKASKAIDANNFDLTAISLAGAREKFAAMAKQAAGGRASSARAEKRANGIA